MTGYKSGNPRPLPSCERLHELFYTDADGVLRWRVNHSSRARAGSIAGYVRKNGYRAVCIDGHVYYAHRIAWKTSTGEEPPVYIDHIDGDKLNNRIHNLRETTQSQNGINVHKNRRNNTSKLHGVSRRKRRGKWRARLKVNYCGFYLGSFDDLIVAALVYDRATLAVFGDYATTNAKINPDMIGDRRLTDAQAAAVDHRLTKHGLLKET